MPAKKSKFKKFIQRLRHKNRLVVIDDDTLEERLSFRLSGMNVFVAIGILSIVLVIITTFIIAFTPLREYIPGYGTYNSDRTVRDLVLRADSLEESLDETEEYLTNIMNIIQGKDTAETLLAKPDSANAKYDNITFTKSKEDSMLRLEMERADQYSLTASSENESGAIASISNLFFFTPLKGTLTSLFDPAIDHYGVDIAAAKDAAIKATLDGTVVFSGWTLKTGNTIAIQHDDNLVSVYKHNSALLKKEGEFVTAGEVIAIIGETGELSTGPHLHFELWYDGSAVNPKDYMVFE